MRFFWLFLLIPSLAWGGLFNAYPNGTPGTGDEFIYWDTDSGSVKNATKESLDTLYDQSGHVIDTANPHSVTKTTVGLSYVENIKHAYGMAITPPVTADSSIGYEAGKSLWLMTSGDVYLCTDASVGASVWSLVGVSDHSDLSNLDYASSGHTGFQPAGSYLTEELDPAVTTHESTYTHGNLPTADQKAGLDAATTLSGTNRAATIADIASAGGGDITGVNAGTGLSGGGLTGDVTVNLENTAVTPGSYTNTNLTVDAQGRITAASSGTGGSSLTLSETDGAPSSTFTELKFPPGSLTDNGNGTATFAEQDPGVATHAALPSVHHAKTVSAEINHDSTSGFVSGEHTDWSQASAGTIHATNYVDNTGTDDQTVDVFSLTGTTLNLSLESDGQATKTVDLSPLQDGTGTDSQTLSFATPNLSISGGNSVNLSGLQDGTGTDDQTAAEVSISDAGLYFTGAEVEAALQEIGPTMTNARTPTSHNNSAHSETYITGNQTITLSGDATGSGTTAIAVTVADDSHSHGSGTITEADPTVAGAITTHEGLADPHTGYMLESNIGTGASNYVQLDGLAKLPAVDGSQLTNLPSPSITASGFDGNLTVTDDTVQEVAQKFDDYLPQWTDIQSMPGGFSDGIDSTGLPTGIILYSDYGTFAAFDTACVDGVLAYADADATLTSQTATLECNIQFLPGTVWTDGGSNDITFSGQLIAGQNQQVFEGFATGLSIGLNTPDLFFNWWGPELSPPFDDQPEFAAMLNASQSGHRLWWEPNSSFSMGRSVTSAKSLKLYGRGSTIKVIDGWEDVADYWLVGMNASLLDSATGLAVSITANTNYFTKPAALDVAVGDYVKIYDSATSHSTDAGGSYYGLQGIVTKIDGTTIYLSGHTEFALTADVAYAYDTILEPVIDGFKFDATGMTTTWALNRLISLSEAYGGEVKNNTFAGSDYSSEAVVIDGSNNTIHDNLCTGFLDTDGLSDGPLIGRQGYCWSVGGNNNIIEKNFSENAKHHAVLGGTPLGNRNAVRDNFIINRTDEQAVIAQTYPGAGSSLKFWSPVDSHVNNHTVEFYDNTIITPGGSGIFNVRGNSGKIHKNTVYITNGSILETNANNALIHWIDETVPRYIEFKDNRVVSYETDWDHDTMETTAGSNTVVFEGNTLEGGFDYLEPACSALNLGATWYAPGAASSTHKICTQTGASTYAWSQSNIPVSTSSQILIGNLSGGGWSAKSLSGVLGLSTSGLSFINDGTIVEDDLDVTSGTRALDLCLKSDGLDGFKWASCSGTAATAASDITVSTTNFGGLFSNSTSFDTSQEIFDYMDDNTAAGDKVFEGDTSIEAVDTGTGGYVKFTADGLDLIKVNNTTGGTYHAYIHAANAATRYTLSVGTDESNKVPRLQLIPDDDVASAAQGAAFFDYGSEDTDLFATTDPRFEVRVMNNSSVGTSMLKAFRDEGVMVRAADVASDIEDADIVANTCTFSQNESTNELVVRCKESGGTVNTYTITADP